MSWSQAQHFTQLSTSMALRFWQSRSVKQWSRLASWSLKEAAWRHTCSFPDMRRGLEASVRPGVRRENKDYQWDCHSCSQWVLVGVGFLQLVFLFISLCQRWLLLLLLSLALFKGRDQQVSTLFAKYKLILTAFDCYIDTAGQNIDSYK